MRMFLALLLLAMVVDGASLPQLCPPQKTYLGGITMLLVLLGFVMFACSAFIARFNPGWWKRNSQRWSDIAIISLCSAVLFAIIYVFLPSAASISTEGTTFGYHEAGLLLSAVSALFLFCGLILLLKLRGPAKGRRLFIVACGTLLFVGILLMSQSIQMLAAEPPPFGC